MRVLSGIQPSGRLHLGNYLGAIKQHLELQTEHECLYFIANYHALTTIRDADQLARNTFDVASDYLALGLDPQRAALFRQTEIPEVTELAWILATVTGKGLMERAHSYKDKVAKGIVPTMGLMSYPLLMAADILIYRSQLVPVGRDQVQHIEMTQDIAGYFNNAFNCNALVRPEGRLNEAHVVPGIDGQKMSSSYGNTIELFDKPKMIRKRIMSIKTDSKSVDQPKDPDSCNLFAIFRLLASPEETAEMADRYRAGGLGYGTVKTRLADLFDEFIGPSRQRREELIVNPDRVEAALTGGATKARAIAEQVMADVRAACGLTVGRGARR
ncbi:MAG: tryptophan--tRNA ligase [Planctomycetes bacterium]|nr:tryptophan--tRNA ligase [Planctomycetota bacterium]